MYNFRIKTFQRNEQLVEAYSRPVGGKEGRKAGIRSKDTRSEKSSARSRRRIRAAVRDYVYSNVWLLFGTLTFSPEFVDRYNWDECCTKARQFLNNYIKRKTPGMMYIMRPELHQDGAIHMHIMLAGKDPDDLVDSGHKSFGYSVYNWPSWKWGFSNLTRVQDSGRCSTYMLKYITDDLSGIPPGKKSYFASHKLKKPKEEVYTIKLPFPQILQLVESLNKERETVWQHDFSIDTQEYQIQGVRAFTKEISQEPLTLQT